MTDAYRQFLEDKVNFESACGIEFDEGQISPILKPHQRDIVRWMAAGGRRANFANFGLGKTLMGIETLRLLQPHSGGPALVVCPLGVRREFNHDGKLLGIDFQFIRRTDEMRAGQEFYLTNYESVREGKIDPKAFGAVNLDEAAVLRSFGSETYQTFLTLFDDVRYRFVSTAVPSPNRYKELIHYAGFLGIMDTGQALTRWFQRDPSQANNLTLYPHKTKEFWTWVASWSCSIQKPSDLGYSDEGYALPELRVHYHEIPVDHAAAGVDRDGQEQMFRNAGMDLQQAAKEKRESIGPRVAKMREIVEAEPKRHFLLWHTLESERHAIAEAVPAAVEVYGTQDLDEREQCVNDFADGLSQYLASKPRLNGSGNNFQYHCSAAVFLGIDHKFHDFIQAIYRIYRFLQQEAVDIHVIFTEAEREVLADLQRKWAEHEAAREQQAQLIREYGLNSAKAVQALTRSIGIERAEESGHNWTVANNDCVDETRRMADNSVDLVVTSIPFSNHYEYTPSYNDFGHTSGDDHFFKQMDFLTPELLRVLKPGRVACIHTKDRILFGNVTGMGMPTVNPFHAKTLFHYQRHGFAYMGMITVVTDVVRENNQTYRLGWSEQAKDGTKMGVGSPEYILLMRKLPTDTSKAYADERVVKDKADYTRARWQVDAHAFWRSSGERLLTAEEMAGYPPDVLSRLFTEETLRTVYDFRRHVAIGQELEDKGALPATFMSLAPGSHHPDVWHDINRMRTLNGEQTRRGLENHICPLQFDIVDRLIERYSNPGETVFDPFGGLYTVPNRAVRLGRKGRASELNAGSHRDGVRYLKALDLELSMPTLFDFEKEAAA